MTVVLTEAGATEIAGAETSGDELWLQRGDVTRACGWTMKPEGLCQGDVCMPVPRADSQRYVRDEQINIAAFWRLMGRPVLHAADGNTWMLGTSASERAAALKTLDAPDFRLPDLDGTLHALSDYRGKRVLLTTWSSW